MKTRFYLKRNLTILFFACLGMFSGNSLHAQLVAGDIAFTGYNSEVSPATGGPYDSFSFVVLRVGGLPANTIINFTDCGWTNTSACGSDQFYPENSVSEATISWQSPGSVLAYGTQVTITGPNASAGAVTSVGVTNPANTGLTFSIGGDQIIAFQGTRASNTIIAAISCNVSATSTDAGWDVGSAPGTLTSMIPPCLTNGVNAILLYTGASAPTGVESDNQKLTCFTATGNRATDLAYCNNRANWVFDDAAAYTLPPAACASPLTATQSQVNLTCNGVCTGQASVVASGGTAPYTYAWSPSGGSGATASSLCATNYTCTITDAASNSITKTFNITQPPAIVVTPISQTNVACNGGATGAAQASASGGTGTLTYNWTPGNPSGDGTGSVTGLTAIVWTVTVTDANSCTANRTFNVTQPPVITVNPVSQTNVSCNGGSNGAASVSVSGGQPGYTYNWTPGNPTGDGTASVTGLTAGNWTCTVTDANACVKTAIFNITAPTAIVVTPVSQTNISCNGGSNGAASVSASGGQPGYTYNWTPGNPTGDGTASVTGLTAGNWTCTVTDANACTNTAAFNITAPTAIVVTPVAQTNISCNGGSNGTGSVSASGGQPGYTYNWTPGNPTGDGTASVTGLTVGNWTCTVTDANACTNTATFNITAPTAIVVTPVAQTNISCNGGSNGAASVSASGGQPGYTYNWTPGNPTGDGTASVTGLTAGNWTCTVTDANACTNTAAFNITAPPAIAASITSTNTSCSSNTGSAAVVASGGTGAYTYSWSPIGGTGATAGSLGVGTYSCLITDANLCSLTKTISIITSAAPTASITSQSNVSCNGLCNGSASVTASGGITPYTYLWSNGNTTANATALCAGLVTGTVTGNNGCSVIVSTTITEPSVLTANASASSILCNGGIATVTVTAAGGTGAYAGTGTFTATAGTKTYTVTDANSCPATASITISQPAILVAGSSASSILCNGGMSTVTVSATGGTGAYTGVGTFTAIAGTQTYTVSDANGCTTTTSVSITEPTLLTANSSASSILCNGGMSTVTVNATGGTPAYTGTGTYTAMAGTSSYTVSDANGCTATTSVSITQPAAITSALSFTLCQGQSVNVATSTYSTAGTFTDVIASLINGCDSTITTNIMINTLPNVTVNSGAICAGESYTLVPNGAVSYTYSSGTDVITPSLTDTYTVTGTDANGCENSAVSSVTVNALPTVSVISSTICAGATGTLTASGADTYTWSTGSNSNEISDNPASTTIYTVSGTSLEGCLGSAVTATITVGAAPSIVVNSESLCAGGSATLTASGVTTYTWSTGENTSTIVVSPTTNTVYTVSGDLAGCSVQAGNAATVTVNALPTVVATTNNTLLCTGETATLSATGAITYTWSTAENTADIAVSPTSTTTYTVDGTDGNGCSNSTTITQDVSMCTGIASVNAAEAFINVYPNPNNGLFNLELNSDAKVVITNAMGQIIVTEEMSSGKHEMDIHNQADGVYFIKVMENNKQHTLKFIKK
jgi:hypothetical protein